MESERGLRLEKVKETGLLIGVFISCSNTSNTNRSAKVSKLNLLTLAILLECVLNVRILIKLIVSLNPNFSAFSVGTLPTLTLTLLVTLQAGRLVNSPYLSKLL